MNRLKQSWAALRLHLQSAAGFTIPELSVSLLMVGTMGAVMAPSMVQFWQTQQLKTANDRVYWALQETKDNAKRDKVTWQTSLQELNGTVYFAVHPSSLQPGLRSWRSLGDRVQIDTQETTFLKTGGIWRVQFDFRGQTNGQLGRVTLGLPNLRAEKRCVIVSTLIGTLRQAKNQSVPDREGRYCY